MNNNEKKKVTIYSVAHEVGVSLATVSRVINETGLVKQDTKDKVEAAIIKLGYRPNAIAQGLALKKTTTIALVVPDSAFQNIGKVINGLLDVAKIYKYNITLHTSSSSINEMSEIVDNIIKSRADGVIVYNDSLSEEEISILQSFKIPVVYIGQKVVNPDACCVYVDYSKALFELVDSYLKKGMDDIILIQDRKNPITIEQLKDGIKQAYDKYGKSFNGFVEIPENYHNSYEFLNDYFKTHKHQVVVTLRDSQAVAVLNTCKENGISIPEDCELVCLLDSRVNDMVRPRISSFVIPTYDIGALSMRVMTKMLNEESIAQREYKLNYIFKTKATTK